MDGDSVTSIVDPMPEVETRESTTPRWAGSRALAGWLSARGELEHIRIAVYFDSIARPDLVVARDLLSHRAHREVFWQSARSLGDEGVFATQGEFDRVETGHLALLESGMRRVVAIAPSDRLEPSDDPSDPGRPALSEKNEKALAREISRTSGEVALLSLDLIAARLERIDDFVESPLKELPGEPAISIESPVPAPSAASPAPAPIESVDMP